MQIQLKDLNIFVKVAENNSFTKAAELLFSSQPSVSKSVQKLEGELKTILFDRSNRRLRLTETGKIVYEKSKVILSTLEDISTSISDLTELVTGHIKIGIPQIIGTFIFPKIAQTYSEKFPGVTLEIKEEGGLVVEKLVEKGLLDIGFVVLPIRSSTLNATSIYKDEFVLCVSSNHHLSNTDSVSLKDLKDEKFILFAKTFALHGLIVDACNEAGFYPDIAFESTQWDLVLELVSAQLGIAVVPKILANKLNAIDIISIPITEPAVIWDIGVITNGKSYQSLALKEFIKVVNDVYNVNS